MAIDQQDIPPAIVIRIQEGAAPAHETRVHAQAQRNCGIVEVSAAAVPIQRGALVREIGAEDVVQPVAVEVRNGNAHPRQSPAVLVEGGSAQHRFVPKRSIASVDVQDRRRSVARNIDIRKVVTAEVAGDRPERIVPIGRVDPAFGGHIREPAAVVAQQFVAREGQPARAARDRSVAIEAVGVLAGLGG